MSKIQELEQQLQEQQSKLTDLQAEIEKLKQAEQNGNQWEPKDNETYWLINSSGEIVHNYWKDYSFERFRLSIGNVFRTEEEAEFEVERRKVYTELKKYSREYIDNEDNYYMYYDVGNDDISYDYEWTVKRTTLYFPSEEIARKAVATVGGDRVKKYYFEVE